MKKAPFIILLVILLCGCTSQTTPELTQSYSDVIGDYSLTLALTDDFSVRNTDLLEGEMTQATLNIINSAENDITSLRAVLINADDLEPIVDVSVIPKVEGFFNRSDEPEEDQFNWDLTAPETLAAGEQIYFSNIKARVYYDNIANGSKIILAKPPNDRVYESTLEEYTLSPIKVFFDTSYETVTTLRGAVKNFTVSLNLFNEFNGYIDYYDNSDIEDNYFRQVVLKVDKRLIFYNALEENTPWTWVGNDSVFNIYRVEFKKLLDFYGGEITNECEIISGIDPFEYQELGERLAEQRKILWMTRGVKKTNILRLGISEVEEPTELSLEAEAAYSYSQDYGGADGLTIRVTGII